MTDILKEILNILKENENIRLIISALLLIFVFRLKDIYEFVDRLLNRKVTRLENLLKGDLDRETRQAVQEELYSRYFQQTTGIKAEKHLREKITKLFESANGRITYSDINHVFKHGFLLCDHNEELRIRKINRQDRISYRFWRIISLSVWVLGLLLILLTILFKIDDPSKIKIGILSTFSPSRNTNEFSLKSVLILHGISWCILAYVMRSQTFVIKIVDKVKSELERQSVEKKRPKSKSIINLFTNLLSPNNLFKRKKK
ncbi:hypothetical protein NIES593_22985 [Hydrococcus rivularis NIES-593]|uniref:Uncharacterized protein n=1 Tax=Hydrococcus rivularis NIES-593 TaxID=1921803 RepID=A0A1U7H6U9_9CYAN|nr:hypothetical protein [Hydrococcus rivularis]OKH17547.1 hypothetical protein NIES593_22985 [Hydrococcus rivularis NIES-593]